MFNFAIHKKIDKNCVMRTKSLCFIIALIVGWFGAKAQDSSADEGLIVFGYCQEYQSSVGQPGRLQAAIAIPETTASGWVGNRLTRIRIGYGRTYSRTVTIFITEDLQKTPLYTQEAEMETLQGWNEVTLDVPFEIDGRSFFVGYTYSGAGYTDYPLGVDGESKYNPFGDYIAVNGAWQHGGSMFGNVCIRLVIEGGSLPGNDAAVKDVSVPAELKPGRSFTAQARVVNGGVNPISALTFECFVGDEKVENPNFTISPLPISTGGEATLKISGLQTLKEGTDIPVEIRLTSVNGEDDERNDNDIASTRFASFGEGFPRAVVVEEWTGTWCGNCPRGIVGMEYMRRNYGDDGFIGIAVHGQDPMEVPTYDPFRDAVGAISYPGAIVNRREQVNPSKETFEKIYKEMRANDVYGEVSSLDVEYIEGSNRLEAHAGVRFSVPVENGDYRLAFVVTENQVGPYNQVNYYAGGSYGSMDGWESKSLNQPWYFDEVARSITGCFGLEGSLPADMEAFREYVYTASLPLDYVETLSRCNVVALLLNAGNGVVVNASSASCYAAGVGERESEDIEITASNGEILIKGDYTECRVMALDGKIVAMGKGKNEIPLPPGLYIVSVTDSAGKERVKKVLLPS